MKIGGYLDGDDGELFCKASYEAAGQGGFARVLAGTGDEEEIGQGFHGVWGMGFIRFAQEIASLG